MMKRTNKRMVICTILIGLNLLLIWGNSLMPGELSSAFSRWVKDLINAFSPITFPETQGGTGLLRKLAHFSEFALLGAVFCWLFGMLRPIGKKQFFGALLSGFLAACIDESIQYFVPGRNCNPIDVTIDTSGVIVGIALLILGHHILKKRHHYMEETL